MRSADFSFASAILDVAAIGVANPALHRLPAAFRARTGYGVLCNTSLNFNGAGFINRTSDLVAYAEQAGLDGFVIEGTLFQRDTSHPHAGGGQ